MAVEKCSTIHNYDAPVDSAEDMYVVEYSNDTKVKDFVPEFDNY